MKVVVVTGATKGIGRAIAEIFAKEGNWKIFICARNENDLEITRNELENKYPQSKVEIMKVDVRQKNEVMSFAEFIGKKSDRVDVLVNNAGVFIPGEISNEEPGILEQMIETNLYSAYHLTRELVRKMKEKKSGHIFNICSIASKIAYPNGGSYSISKFALLGFSKVLREEMKAHNVRVSAVLPGATWSNSWKGVDLPESRLMQARDIAIMVKAAYDLSDSAVMEDIVLRPQLGDL